MRTHVPLNVAAIALLVGCSAPSETQSPSPTPPRVPAQAPDRIPERLFDPNSLRNLPCITGPADRGIVVVRFQEGVTQAQRQEAVDQVGASSSVGFRRFRERAAITWRSRTIPRVRSCVQPSRR